MGSCAARSLASKLFGWALPLKYVIMSTTGGTGSKFAASFAR